MKHTLAGWQGKSWMEGVKAWGGKEKSQPCAPFHLGLWAWHGPGGGGETCCTVGFSLYSPWPILIPEPRLCLEVTSDCPLSVGLPETSPRSGEILAPVRSSQGWWETTLEFIFITPHEQCVQHTCCKQNKSGLSNGELKSSLRWVATGLVHQLSEGQVPSSSSALQP